MTDAALSSIIPNVRDEDLAGALEQAVRSTLNDTFNVAIRVNTWRRDKTPVDLSSNAICVLNMHQPDVSKAVLIVTLSQDAIVKLLAALGVPESDKHAAINDAIEEITNMIYGMVKTILNADGHHFGTAFPIAVEDKDLEKLKLQQAEKIVLPFLADGHKCQIAVAFGDMEKIN